MVSFFEHSIAYSINPLIIFLVLDFKTEVNSLARTIKLMKSQSQTDQAKTKEGESTSYRL